MDPKTEGVHNAEFLLSEGNGQISRELILIAAGAGIVAAGTMLTAANAPITTNYGDAAKIVYGTVDATAADAEAAAIARHAEVHGELLNWPTAASDDDKVAASTALAAQGIIVRWTVAPVAEEEEGEGGET